MTPAFAAPPLPTDPSLLDPQVGNDALASFRDIHLPPPVGLWPLAPGWWALAGLLFALLLLGAVLEWRRRQTLGYRAMRALDAVASDTARYADARAVAAEAALLMRRVVVSRTGRASAALAGADWQSFLGEGKGGLPAEVGAFIAEAPYLPPGLPDADRIARARLVASVRHWIRCNA